MHTDESWIISAIFWQNSTDNTQFSHEVRKKVSVVPSSLSVSHQDLSPAAVTHLDKLSFNPRLRPTPSVKPPQRPTKQTNMWLWGTQQRAEKLKWRLAQKWTKTKEDSSGGRWFKAALTRSHWSSWLEGRSVTVSGSLLCSLSCCNFCQTVLDSNTELSTCSLTVISSNNSWTPKNEQSVAFWLLLLVKLLLLPSNNRKPDWSDAFCWS